MFALDTNTVIHFFKGAGRVSERLLRVPPSEIGIPAVVVYELEVGVAGSTQSAKRRHQLDDLLSAVTILPFGEGAARRAAEIETGLRKIGLPIGPVDTLIAGTALATGATLVTHNVAEFRRVRRLALADWY